jgi:uncharacterized membrane protein YbhN (UPF0104 family)
MKNYRPIIFSVLRLLVVIVLIIPILYTLYKHWLNVQLTLKTANWLPVIVGLFLLMLAQPLMGVISWLILRQLDQKFGYVRILSVYFISQAAKYLPGGIWAFPGRVVAYQAIGVESGASLVSMVREVGVLFIGAALIGLAGLLSGVLVSDWVRFSVIAGIVVCILSVALVQLPFFWRLLARFRFIKNSGVTEAQAEVASLSFTWLPVPLLVSISFWVLTGIAFREMAAGFSGSVLGMTWLQTVSIFALAWCAGFIVVIAPAGLGVRETVLSALLSSYMPLGEALSIALIARLWWTLGEAVFIVFSIIKFSITGQQVGIDPNKDR